MWTFQRSTHPREPHLLPLVERLVEVHERGADRGGSGAHGGETLAHRVHAADRGERALGGAGAAERVGGLERGGDELVEGDAPRGAQTPVALDLAHRPAAQHRRKLLAHGAPAGRGGLASGLAWGGLARGSLAGGGVGAGARWRREEYSRRSRRSSCASRRGVVARALAAAGAA